MAGGIKLEHSSAAESAAPNSHAVKVACRVQDRGISSLQNNKLWMCPIATHVRERMKYGLVARGVDLEHGPVGGRAAPPSRAVEVDRRVHHQAGRTSPIAAACEGVKYDESLRLRVCPGGRAQHKHEECRCDLS